MAGAGLSTGVTQEHDKTTSSVPPYCQNLTFIRIKIRFYGLF